MEEHKHDLGADAAAVVTAEQEARHSATARHTRWSERRLSQDYIPPVPWTAEPCETEGEIGGHEPISGANLIDANGDTCFSLDLGADCAFFNNATVAFIAHRVNQHDEMLAALKALANEASAAIHLNPQALIEAVGVTNLRCLSRAVDNARAGIAKAEGSSK